MWYFSSPKLIVFGEDALEYLESVKASKVFIVTDKNIASFGLLEKVLKHLEVSGVEVKVFDEVEPEPPKETIFKGAELASQFKPDLIIGLGGGSCIDSAKAIRVLYERPDVQIEEISPLTNLGLGKKTKLICIPTTSGTGAEATWAVVITDKRKKVKLELASREVISDVAILDPELVKKLPKKLTVEPALDALAQAIEAYISQWKNDFSDALAVKAVQLIFKYLPRAYKKGSSDIEAREKMHIAATLSGLAFSNSQVTILHALAHSAGAIFRIPHGRAVALFTPYSLRFNFSKSWKLYAELAETIGLKAVSKKELAVKFLNEIEKLLKELKVATAVKDLRIEREEYLSKINELVERTMESTGLIANPREVTEDDVKKLFIYAYEGKNVDF